MEMQADLLFLSGWAVAAGLAGTGVPWLLRNLVASRRAAEEAGDEKDEPDEPEAEIERPMVTMGTVTAERRRQALARTVDSDLGEVGRQLRAARAPSVLGQAPVRAAPEMSHVANFQRLYETFEGEPTGVFGGSSYEAAVEMRRLRLQTQAELERYMAKTQALASQVETLQASLTSARGFASRVEKTLNTVVADRDALRVEVEHLSRSDLPTYTREELRRAVNESAVFARVLSAIVTDRGVHPPDQSETT